MNLCAQPRSLVLATHNPHKVREIGRLLAPAAIAVEPLPDWVELPPEEGETYQANALPKARAAAVTGQTSIGDDSGIEAEALGGAPGVRSARFAGPSASDEENLLKLIREVPVGSPLRYVCVIAFVDPAVGKERTFTGVCHGRMAAERRGTRGFGYDPVFLPDALAAGRTMAELEDSEKDTISHRGLAARALLDFLAAAEPRP